MEGNKEESKEQSNIEQRRDQSIIELLVRDVNEYVAKAVREADDTNNTQSDTTSEVHRRI